MKKNNLLKLLVIAIVIIIISIIVAIVIIKKGSKTSEDVNQESSLNNTVNNENIYPIDISDIWQEITGMDEYRTFASLEIYIQKYFEKEQNRPINNFSAFNLDDVWCYNKPEGESEVDEYYINGYICNNDFSEIKQVAIKFSVQEDHSYKVESLNNVDFTNVTWDSFIISKTEEIKSELSAIQEQNEKINASSENDEETITDEKEQIVDDNNEVADQFETENNNEETMTQYNENKFEILNVTDKELINRYFLNYKIKVLVNPQRAYQMLNEETKNDLFKTYEEFGTNILSYINKDTTLSKVKIVRPVLNEDENTNLLVEYLMADNNSNTYEFEIKALNDYTVFFSEE